eukprot:symbB.v1.2.022949.t1/scaffold2067.1/size90749/9
MFRTLLGRQTSKLSHSSSFELDQQDSYRCGERFDTEETALPEGNDLEDLEDDASQRLEGLRKKIAHHDIAVAAELRESLEDFRFSIVSQGFEDLLGYSRKELEQKELTRLISSDCLVAFSLEQLTSLTGAWRRVVLRRKSGDLVEVVAMLQCIDVAGIYLFMCLEVLDGEAHAGEQLVQKMQELKEIVEGWYS